MVMMLAMPGNAGGRPGISGDLPYLVDHIHLPSAGSGGSVFVVVV